MAGIRCYAVGSLCSEVGNLDYWDGAHFHRAVDIRCRELGIHLAELGIGIGAAEQQGSSAGTLPVLAVVRFVAPQWPCVAMA